ncbi:hypothetical protein AB5J52_49880 (plasmid) [Streptomyces sp. R39]|uniref:Uncharacterized protein n=1 Tax=Streptomyces sp. R39 TaxID=3238631 RepID=A0AB39RB42_9ACTN
MTDPMWSAGNGAGGGLGGATSRDMTAAAETAAEETVRLLRLGRDPYPHALSTGAPALPALAPETADLVRRARLGECGAVHRVCARAMRPARRIVRRYLWPGENEAMEEVLFDACRRAVHALQQTAQGDKTFDFEREVRIGVRLAAGDHVLRKEVTGGDRRVVETLLAYDVLASLPSHHADVLWTVDVEGEPAGRYPPGLLRTGRDALVDAYLWRGLRRTGPVEGRWAHLSYLTAASYVRCELTAGRTADVRNHLRWCALCRLLTAETAGPGTSLPSELTRAVTARDEQGRGWTRWRGGCSGRAARGTCRPAPPAVTARPG